MDVRSRRCWRVRRRVELLEEGVFAIWESLVSLWNIHHKRRPLPEEPPWIKELKRLRSAAPHPPCGGERPAGRKTGKEVRAGMSVEKRRKMFLKWLFKRGYSEKELEPLPAEVVEKAMRLFEEAMDVADSLTNVLGELADLFDEAGRPGLAKKCRGIATTVRIASAGIRGFAEMVEGMAE